MRWKGVVCGVVILIILLGGTSFSATRDTVTIALPQDIVSMTPYRSRHGGEMSFHHCIFQSLVAPLTETGEWVPWLAESVRLTENQLDVEVMLRKDAKFHTGDPVTAEDVRFTWLLFTADKNNPNAYARYFRRVKDVEIIDDHHLIFSITI